MEKVKLTPPASAIFLTLLGDAYFRKGYTDKAEENYLLALAAQKNNAEAVLGLARVSQNRGDTKATLGYLSQARELAGNPPQPLFKIRVLDLGCVLLVPPPPAFYTSPQ